MANTQDSIDAKADNIQSPSAKANTPLKEQVPFAGSDAKTQTEVKASPKLPASDFTWGGYFQSIGILLVLLAALWAVVWLLRKYGRFNFIPRPGAFPHDGLRLEAQLPLGPRKGLSVVRFLDKRLLLGVTDKQITLLQEIGDHDENDSKNFRKLLEEATHAKSTELLDEKPCTPSEHKQNDAETDVQEQSKPAAEKDEKND